MNYPSKDPSSEQNPIANIELPVSSVGMREPQEPPEVTDASPVAGTTLSVISSSIPKRVKGRRTKVRRNQEKGGRHTEIRLSSRANQILKRIEPQFTKELGNSHPVGVKVSHPKIAGVSPKKKALKNEMTHQSNQANNSSNIDEPLQKIAIKKLNEIKAIKIERNNATSR